MTSKLPPIGEVVIEAAIEVASAVLGELPGVASLRAGITHLQAISQERRMLMLAAAAVGGTSSEDQRQAILVFATSDDDALAVVRRLLEDDETCKAWFYGTTRSGSAIR